MTTAAVIQARNTSTRLPGKVIQPLAGKPVIRHLAERAHLIEGVDLVCVAIPEGPDQAPLADVIRGLSDVTLVEGPEEDLCRRFAIAVEETGADTIVRIWSDCPALDPGLAALPLREHAAGNAVATIVGFDSGYPEGLECQVLSADAILTADREAVDFDSREDIVPYFEQHPDRFPIRRIYRPPGNARVSPVKILLDTEADYRRINEIFEILTPVSPVFGLDEIEQLAETRPDLFLVA